MIRAFLVSFRLAFAFVCVGVGLILGAQWFGLIPDSRLQTDFSQRKFCETVAIGMLDDIEQGRFVQLGLTLEVLADRNADLISAGFRSDSGTLRASTADHSRSWRLKSDESDLAIPEWARGSSDGAPPVTDDSRYTSVPVMSDQTELGALEFVFRDPSTGWLNRYFDPSLLRLLGFFVGVGLCSYTLLMMRIMGTFARGNGVPDGVRHALDTLAEGLLLLDESGKIVLANQTFTSINGYDPEELADLPASKLPWTFAIGDGGTPERVFPWTAAIKTRQTVTGQILRLTGRDGTLRVYSVNAASIGEERDKRGALVTFQDVTHVEKHRAELENMLSVLKISKAEIEQKNDELEVLATRDALTGCLNRRAFFEKTTELFASHRLAGTPLSCFMVDVDHFKRVNDTYGHHTGDEVLRKVARVLRDLHEESQIVCRYGGEEFCVVLPGCDLDEALIQAECTRLALAEIRLVDPASLRLTASLGVSELRFGAGDVQELINQADACLYVAKRGGRNQSVPYDPDRIEAMGGEVTNAAEKIADPDVSRLPFLAVTAMLSALAYRHARSAEHSRRVANLCVHVADGLMCQHEIYLLEVAALLHDIGKIGVPDEVLNKTSPLTDEEWRVMRRHNVIGLDMIRGTFHCPALELVIQSHHNLQIDRSLVNTPEAWASIPLQTRLLSIADAYDAVTSDHVYRKGSSHKQAAAELRRCAGTQFDPELVELFLSRVVGHETDNAIGVPTTRGISFAIAKPTALKIGQQIERLCDVIDEQSLPSLNLVSGELLVIAQEGFLMPIVDAVTRIQTTTQTKENVQWADVLADTRELLELCRLTQNAHLVEL